MTRAHLLRGLATDHGLYPPSFNGVYRTSIGVGGEWRRRRYRPEIGGLDGIWVDSAHGDDLSGDGTRAAPLKTMRRMYELLGPAPIIHPLTITLVTGEERYAMFRDAPIPLTSARSAARAERESRREWRGR